MPYTLLHNYNTALSFDFLSFSQIEPDRQQEMTSLLASGLTLTDAKKYLANKKEQEEIERRMINAQSRRHNPQPGQGRGRGKY